ncbi:MAG: protein-L-isoaspartate O-methyltransferase [Zetaproteobacteria bacterium]|nr:protein-L-isoaspartate O-methyltransferase [Pseudobdellovibrionaceae bacterium]
MKKKTFWCDKFFLSVVIFTFFLPVSHKGLWGQETNKNKSLNKLVQKSFSSPEKLKEEKVTKKKPQINTIKNDPFALKRKKLIEELEEGLKKITYLSGKVITVRQDILDAFDKTPRHEFVLKTSLDEAYENRPLPIGFGQTISQPYIVALMTHLLETEKNHRVLEIGTGSAYQAAILSPLIKEVYSIEIIYELGVKAKEKLKKLAYQNVFTKIADGYHGWKEKGPFDGIIVTAAASHLPPPLIKQLKVGGRIVIPVGSTFQTQILTVVEKKSSGSKDALKVTRILPVRFVPFVGDIKKQEVK